MSTLFLILAFCAPILIIMFGVTITIAVNRIFGSRAL